jgi:hypothetical protein
MNHSGKPSWERLLWSLIATVIGRGTRGCIAARHAISHRPGAIFIVILAGAVLHRYPLMLALFTQKCC